MSYQYCEGGSKVSIIFLILSFILWLSSPIFLSLKSVSWLFAEETSSSSFLTLFYLPILSSFRLLSKALFFSKKSLDCLGNWQSKLWFRESVLSLRRLLLLWGAIVPIFLKFCRIEVYFPETSLPLPIAERECL